MHNSSIKIDDENKIAHDSVEQTSTQSVNASYMMQWFDNNGMLKMLNEYIDNTKMFHNITFKVAGRFVHSTMSMHQASMREMTHKKVLQSVNSSALSIVEEYTTRETDQNKKQER